MYSRAPCDEKSMIVLYTHTHHRMYMYVSVIHRFCRALYVLLATLMFSHILLLQPLGCLSVFVQDDNILLLEECLAFLASGSDPTCRVSIIYTTWPKSHAYHGVPRLEKS